MAGSPFHKSGEAEPIADVNVVPLADVSLVLLIILLVLSPMAAQSMLRVQAAAAKAQAALPSAPIVTAREEPEAVLALEVSEGGFTLDGRLYASRLELEAKLKELLPSREDKKVFVSPDLDCTHGRVVEALEAAHAAGGQAALVQILDPEAP